MKKRFKDQISSLPYDADGRFAVALAFESALKWGHPALTPAHLLSGVLQRVPELIAKVEPEVACEKLRRLLEASGVKAGRSPQPIPYSDRSRKVLAVAREKAFRAESSAVGAEHILLALRSHGDDTCAAFFDQPEGADDDSPALQAQPLPVDLAWLQVSDESAVPYHAQLAEQIRDAIASGRLLVGQRLPTVRRLAESLDLAPGTVAKAYRALDESGVLYTAGTRGTTVAMAWQEREDSEGRIETLVGLLRPVAVTAFHMGGNGAELRTALDQAVEGVFST